MKYNIANIFTSLVPAIILILITLRSTFFENGGQWLIAIVITAFWFSYTMDNTTWVNDNQTKGGVKNGSSKKN